MIELDEKEIKLEMERRISSILNLPLSLSKRLLRLNDYNIFESLMYAAQTKYILFNFLLDYKDPEEVKKLRVHYKNGTIYDYIENLLSEN